MLNEDNPAWKSNDDDTADLSDNLNPPDSQLEYPDDDDGEDEYWDRIYGSSSADYEDFTGLEDLGDDDDGD